MILLDMDVFAMLTKGSRPSCDTLVLTFSFMYFTASLSASLYPVMMVVGWSVCAGACVDRSAVVYGVFEQ